MRSVVKLKDLRKEYPEFILDNVNLDIPAGYITGVIGPNGAGKTTTIKLIMNLIQADGGEVEVLGLTHDQFEKNIKDRIGYVGEEQFFYEHRSAGWTGKFVSHFYSKWDRGRYLQLLGDFKLPLKKKIKTYSKGMRVKLSLAIALSHDPELIILDEPTAGLDPVVRREVLDLLQKVTLEEKRSVIISSHITDDISRVADYIAYMINGRFALFSTKDELQADWKTIHFKKDSLAQSIADSLENVETQMFGSSGVTRRYREIEAALADGLASGDIKVENVGLDDILIAMVHEK
jgi:ABC-2 type transport system ATP-binding protein